MFVIAQVCEDMITGKDVVHYWHGGNVWGTEVEEAARFVTRGDVAGTIDVIRRSGDPIPTAHAVTLTTAFALRSAAF